jgi:hypothetical protein
VCFQEESTAYYLKEKWFITELVEKSETCILVTSTLFLQDLMTSRYKGLNAPELLHMHTFLNPSNII